VKALELEAEQIEQAILFAPHGDAIGHNVNQGVASLYFFFGGIRRRLRPLTAPSLLLLEWRKSLTQV